MTDLASNPTAGHPRHAAWDNPIAFLGDISLVVAVARRRSDALAEAYRRHGRSIYALACRLVGPASAEEVTERVILRLWFNPEAFDPAYGSLRSQLLTDAHARAAGLLRNSTTGRRRAAAAPGVTARSDDIDVETDLQAILSGADPETRGTLVGLPDTQRQAIVLAYFAGCTYRQVAARLHRPPETINNDIRAGLTRLREGVSH